MAYSNILRPNQARQRLGLGKTKFWALVKGDPTFPKLIELGPRARGVFEDELNAWAESRRSKAVR